MCPNEMSSHFFFYALCVLVGISSRVGKEWYSIVFSFFFTLRQSLLPYGDFAHIETLLYYFSAGACAKVSPFCEVATRLPQGCHKVATWHATRLPQVGKHRPRHRPYWLNVFGPPHILLIKRSPLVSKSLVWLQVEFQHALLYLMCCWLGSGTIYGRVGYVIFPKT